MVGTRIRWFAFLIGVSLAATVEAQAKKPNILVLMSDDRGGWTSVRTPADGRALGHPTPNLDRLAREGAVFTSWYGQASCSAGRASFNTGRIPIRSALSIVIAPGDENYLHKETPTIAEWFRDHGYTTPRAARRPGEGQGQGDRRLSCSFSI